MQERINNISELRLKASYWVNKLEVPKNKVGLIDYKFYNTLFSKEAIIALFNGGAYCDIVNKRYLVIITSLWGANNVKALAHELIHIKRGHLEELEKLPGGKYILIGTIYSLFHPKVKKWEREVKNELLRYFPNNF